MSLKHALPGIHKKGHLLFLFEQISFSLIRLNRPALASGLNICHMGIQTILRIELVRPALLGHHAVGQHNDLSAPATVPPVRDYGRLPPPDGPTSAVTSPCFAVKATSFRVTELSFGCSGLPLTDTGSASSTESIRLSASATIIIFSLMYIIFVGVREITGVMMI